MNDNSHNQGIVSSENDPDFVDSNREEISKVGTEFFAFSVSPTELSDKGLMGLWGGSFEENGELLTDEELLTELETNYDLNKYVNYDDLSVEEKLIAHESVISNKIVTSMMGEIYTYEIDPEKIQLDGDRATLPGEGIKVTIDTEKIEESGFGAQDLDKEIILDNNYFIQFINTDNGWKVDGKSLVNGLGMDTI